MSNMFPVNMKEQAIKSTMAKYPAMNEIVAKFYVEEVLGYSKS